MNVGFGISEIALNFWGSGDIPVLLNLCPRNVMLLTPKTHFDLVNFSPESLIFVVTLCTQLLCSARVAPHTAVSSSWLFLAPSNPSIILEMLL